MNYTLKSTIRKREIEEAMDIKTRLANSEIYCTSKTIERGVIIPDDKPEDELKRRRKEYTFSLRPMHNPFFVPKKKGKKKKKKKGA